MNILIVGFNIDGAMADNLIGTTRELIKNKQNRWFLLTKKAMEPRVTSLDLDDTLFVDYDKSSLIGMIKQLTEIIKYIKLNEINAILFLTPNLIYNVFISMYFRNIVKLYYLHDPEPHSGESKKRKVMLLLQNYIVCHLSQCIMVASESIKNYIIKFNILKLKNKIIEVVYLGELENLEFYDIKNGEAKDEFDVLFFGRIEHYKGIDNLARAIKILNNENLKIKCKVVGKGNINKFVDPSVIHLLDIDNNYVDDRQLAEYINRSKIIVFPYKNATGSQTIQACYYYNKPVIATNVGCFKDYVVNNETGLLCNADDDQDLAKSIKLLLGDSEKRVQYGKNGNILLRQKFNMEVIAHRYYEIFNRFNEEELM